MSDKKYVVECCIGVYGNVNWQGASAWHNGDPGEDETYYMLLPKLQLVYNQTTDTWHQPGYRVIGKLPEQGDFHTEYKKIEVGSDPIPKKNIKTMLKRKLDSKEFYTTITHLDEHDEEGRRRADEKYESHAYTMTWDNEYEVILRVREIVDTPPTNKRDIWERRDPKQYKTDNFYSNLSPYEFSTKHTFVTEIYPEDAQEVWERIQHCLETKGDFGTLLPKEDSTI